MIFAITTAKIHIYMFSQYVQWTVSLVILYMWIVPLDEWTILTSLVFIYNCIDHTILYTSPAVQI